MSKPSNRVVEFGPFRLETAERLLLREGKPVPLTPKAFDTLLALVQSSGRLVQKDDLIKQVWPDAIVEEANLARNVYALRKALGDGNDEPAYIETVPKLGYRFIAPVREVSAERASAPITQSFTSRPVVVEERPAAPPMSPSRERHRVRLFVLVALAFVSVGVTSVSLLRFWREPAPSTRTELGRTVLTDGSHDDLAASWTSHGEIHFSRVVTTARVETWTMNADGTNQHRANTAIKSLLAGRWSPDGKQVIFSKDGDPHTAYLADADGAHEIVLPFFPGNLDWSPDGSQFVYQANNSSGTSELFLYTVQAGQSVNLTHNVASADPSFSSDGTAIAFTSWRDGNAEIYVMRADGSHLRRVTNHPAFDNYPVFSPDGTQIAFQSNREDEHIEVFLQNLDDNTPPKRLTKSSTLTGLAPKCWSPDGTRMLVYTNRNDQHQIEMIDVDPFPARLLLGDDLADLSSPRLAAGGARMLYEARLANQSLELRVIDFETRRTSTLFTTEPDYPRGVHLAPAWSPIESRLAFSARVDGNSEIFTMKPDGSDLRNVTNNPLLDATPAFSADGREIVFARDTYGQAQLYRMNVDGTNPRRVTDTSGYEMTPAVSPDGVHLAFAADRDSRGLDIFLLDLRKPMNETRLAVRRSQDTLPSFSVDGKRIAFIATSDGNSEIYVMNSDGTGLFRVTHSKAEETDPQFSSDGKHIVFSSNRAGRFALYEIDVR